ncbi:MAG: hypothetical protein JNL96_26665 [Planctomycetaceae bacterium]|nr:hypothetical protein [Planctomycetaceae bacterium]
MIDPIRRGMNGGEDFRSVSDEGDLAVNAFFGRLLIFLRRLDRSNGGVDALLPGPSKSPLARAVTCEFFGSHRILLIWLVTK